MTGYRNKLLCLLWLLVMMLLALCVRGPFRQHFAISEIRDDSELFVSSSCNWGEYLHGVGTPGKCERMSRVFAISAFLPLGYLYTIPLLLIHETHHGVAAAVNDCCRGSFVFGGEGIDEERLSHMVFIGNFSTLFVSVTNTLKAAAGTLVTCRGSLVWNRQVKTSNNAVFLVFIEFNLHSVPSWDKINRAAAGNQNSCRGSFACPTFSHPVPFVVFTNLRGTGKPVPYII